MADPRDALIAELQRLNEQLGALVAQQQSVMAAQRQLIAPGQGATAGLTLPDGTPVVANGGGNTYTIQSRATLANGASTLIDASIRLGGIGVSGRPYTVLRWRDDEKSR